jgi:hypothetical protein
MYTYMLICMDVLLTSAWIGGRILFTNNGLSDTNQAHVQTNSQVQCYMTSLWDVLEIRKTPFTLKSAIQFFLIQRVISHNCSVDKIQLSTVTCNMLDTGPKMQNECLEILLWTHLMLQNTVFWDVIIFSLADVYHTS